MKNWLIFIILVVLLFSCGKNLEKKRNNDFYIFGQLKNVHDNTKVYLKVQESNRIITLDTAYVSNNMFEFNGNINKPEVFGIYIDSIKGSIGLFIHNDSISINVDENKLSNSTVKGSELNDKYLSFTKKSNEIISKTSYLFPLFQKARTENDVDKINEINKKIEAIHNENRVFTLNFARENPNSYIAAFALQTLLNDESVSIDSIASVYNNFSHEVKKGDFAIEILLYLESQEQTDEVEN
ncbi:DUF4369 domain-containing protein [Aureibaculum conchae]|uniref:DUF4369 domain-containing protein n=1 Tax=Aureibaculum sp. 2308TA14-22 TaxID=3108392 RepID=UPI0033989293